jgi:uncharacterized protein (TIGR00106 family)
MAIVEVSITPLGTVTSSMSWYVAECIKVAEQSDLKYQLTPMGTIFEGDLDRILGTIRRMQESVFATGAGRVTTMIKIDDRRDKPGQTMEDKVAAVESML